MEKRWKVQDAKHPHDFPDDLWSRHSELEVREANGFVGACHGS